MNTNNEDPRTEVLSLVQDPRFQNEIAQIESKAFLSEVVKEPAEVNWNYVLQRVVRQMVLVTFDLENIARDAPQEMGELRRAAGQIASTWESLAKLQEGANQNTALLNAAVNYELAGYQANAAYLASRVVSSNRQLDRPNLPELCSAFLQRGFLRSLDLASQAQAPPRMDEEADYLVEEALAVAAAARGLSSAVRFFLRGERAWIPYASDWLERSEKLFASLALAEEANLIRSLRSLIPTMQQRSTWTYLSDKAPERPKWQRYLKLLARGVGNDVYRSRSVSELWPSQMIIRARTAGYHCQ